MKKLLLATVSVAVIASAVPTQAATYTFVGSWSLGDGSWWATNPPVYSGVEAAAHLFGGSASDYAISTIDSNPSNINFKTWLDGWRDPYTYAYNGTPAADTYSLDTGGFGYDSNPGYQSAYSAYVQDHFSQGETVYVNYAFRISGTAVPEASTWAMMIAGFGMIGVALRRRRLVAFSFV
jgi:hypothetical protein